MSRRETSLLRSRTDRRIVCFPPPGAAGTPPLPRKCCLMNAPALRALSIGEILDTAFALYRREFRKMVLVTAIFMVPLIGIELVVPVGGLAVAERLGGILMLGAMAAVVLIASECYLGRSITAGDAMKAANSRFLSVWGAAIMQSILVGLGLILLIIPGIIALAYTFAMQQAVMIEGASASDAWERSKDLARDHFWRIAGTSVVAFFITFVAAMAFGAFTAQFFPDPRWNLIATNVLLVLVYPFSAVVSTVLYYDLRVRKEGYDVQLMAEQIGGAPVPAV